MARFQIVQGSPVHCQITDGIVGSSYRVLPMTYFNERYANALAGFMGRRNWEECGDDWFYVIPAGERALNRLGRENRVTGATLAGGGFPITEVDSDEIPF